MIYNRTYADIINARKIFASKVQNFEELTDEEQATIDRAFFNTVSINRINEKINQIWELVVANGGEKVESDDVREWGDQEFFTVSNFENIRKNILDIISQARIIEYFDFEKFESMYGVLNDEYVYTNLNNIEKILNDIYNIFYDFAIQIGGDLYIFGTREAVFIGKGVLKIE